MSATINGIFDATSERTIACPRPDSLLTGGEQGAEDCLILNIFAKKINLDIELKKVIVFIHGGSFVTGSSGLFNMSSFVKAHDIIGITINYRIGILGFLSLGNDASPGNYGLWDQVMALQWIKDNIKAFGGDPNDITISGQSAGGASVAYLSLSPVTKGLFLKACLGSGSATSVFGQDLDVKKHALMIAKSVYCWDGNTTDELDFSQSKALMTCLRDVELSVLTSINIYSLSEPMFVPTIDGKFVPKKPLLLLNDESYLESIGFYDKSYLVSLVSNEFAMMNSAYETIQVWILKNNDTSQEEKKQMILRNNDDIKSYFMQTRLNRTVPSTVENIMNFYNRRFVGDAAVLIHMVADLSFLIPSYEFLNAASRKKKCKSWFLYFNYFPAYMKGRYRGMAHGADLLYWQDISVADLNALVDADMEGEMDAYDLRLKIMYSSMIAGFVKQGDPGFALKELVPSGWPVYEPDSAYYLNFNLQPSLRDHLEREKIELWFEKVPEWSENIH